MKEERERRREGKEGKRKSEEGGREIINNCYCILICLPVSLYIILAMPNEDSM